MSALSPAIRVLAAMFIMCSAPLRAQDGPLPGKLYIGLTIDSLQKNDESELRAFLVLRGLVDDVARHLSKTVGDIRIADMDSWSPTDSWKLLAARGYTHYLIAQIKREGHSLRVDWNIGKLSGGSQSFAASLKTRTFISIPVNNEEAAIQEQQASGYATKLRDIGSNQEMVGRIVDSLRAVFPEMRSMQRYFVDCFDNNVPMKQWEQAHREIMRFLSGNLEIGVWHPILVFRNQDQAGDLCRSLKYQSDPGVHYEDSDYLIWGVLYPDESRKHRLQAEISFLDKIDEKRGDVSWIEPAYEHKSTPVILRDFCIRDRDVLSKSIMDGLTRYIQVNGFHVSNVQAINRWKCHAEN
jgi:hypothetical protein